MPTIITAAPCPLAENPGTLTDASRQGIDRECNKIPVELSSEAKHCKRVILFKQVDEELAGMGGAVDRQLADDW